MGSTGGRDGGDSLRGLTGAGPSKVGVDKAMRARDVSRPHDEPDRDEGGRTGVAGEQRDPPPTTQKGPQSVGGSGSTGSSPDSS